MRNDCGKICGAVDSAPQKKEVILVVAGNLGSRDQGVPRSERVLLVDLWRKASFTSRRDVVN